MLDAVAKATGRLMCEVVADEYGCTVSETPIPIFTQSGDDRYDNADKMIIKGAQVLPHASDQQRGRRSWACTAKSSPITWPGSRDRILPNGCTDESYMPVLHIDCVRHHRRALRKQQLLPPWPTIWPSWSELAKPFHLRIEGPMDCDCDRETQIEALAGPDRRAGPPRHSTWSW